MKDETRELIKEHAIYAIFWYMGILFIFAVSCFLCWDVRPSNWSFGARTVVVAAWVLFTVMVVGTWIEKKGYKLFR